MLSLEWSVEYLIKKRQSAYKLSIYNIDKKLFMFKCVFYISSVYLLPFYGTPLYDGVDKVH